MASPQALKHVLIFANGDLNEGKAVQAALAQPAFVIAADGGAEWALKLGCSIALLVGDMDSITSTTLDLLEHSGVEIMRLSPQKNETDLELALTEAAKRGAQSICIIGGLGNRLDQTVANLYLLSLPVLAGIDVRLVSGNQSTWIAREGDHLLMGEVGDTVSLLPLGGDVEGVTTVGLQYPLRDETLAFGPARGVSNVIAALPPRLSIRKGRLLVVHTQGRA